MMYHNNYYQHIGKCDFFNFQPTLLNRLTVELVSNCWASVLVHMVLNLTVSLWTVTAPVSELGGNFSSAKAKHHDLSRLLDHWIQQSVTLKTKCGLRDSFSSNFKTHIKRVHVYIYDIYCEKWEQCLIL